MTTTTTTFRFDAFARQHLRGWYDADRAPNDWYLSDLWSFERWIMVHAEEWPDNASWPAMTHAFDTERERTS